MEEGSWDPWHWPNLRQQLLHILATPIQIVKQRWRVKSAMHLRLVSHPVLSKLNPCPFPFSHAGLDRAQCCFPPAVTCFRKPDLVKASPSHIFIWHLTFLMPVDSKAPGTELIDTEISGSWNNLLLTEQLFYFISMVEKDKCASIIGWKEKTSQVN